jgi:hypothetical protein
MAYDQIHEVKFLWYPLDVFGWSQICIAFTRILLVVKQADICKKNVMNVNFCNAEYLTSCGGMHRKIQKFFLTLCVQED